MNSIDILSAYERGLNSGPLERAALLAEFSLGSSVRDEPLGNVDRAIWALRMGTVDGPANAIASCPHCAAELEFTLPQEFVIPEAHASSALVSFEDQEFEVAMPSLSEMGPDGPDCHRLSPEAPWHVPSFSQAAEAALEAADPGLRVLVSLDCADCGKGFDAPMDIAGFFWRELAGMARRLLGDVATLARAFSWSEAEIVGMTPTRRALYVAEISS